MKSKNRFIISLSICVLLLSGLACTTSLLQLPSIPAGPTEVPTTVVPSPTPQPRAQTTFTAVLPEPLAPGESLTMNVMDEVTGLALNATTYPMQAKDNLTYTATLPLPLNAVIKYRYIRQTSVPISEDTANNTPIRYRLYDVAGQGEVQDMIGSWSDKNTVRPLGGIQDASLIPTPVRPSRMFWSRLEAFRPSPIRLEISICRDFQLELIILWLMQWTAHTKLFNKVQWLPPI